jgi:hypothetical protein
VKSVFYQEALNLIKFPENRVQDQLIILLTKLSKEFSNETKQFFAETEKELLSLIKKTTVEEQNNFIPTEKMMEILLNSPFPNQLNKLKVIEPMF